MTNLDRRIDRLEERMGMKPEPRVVVVTINPDNLPESPYAVELFPGAHCAYAIRGGAFTEEDICGLRQEYEGSRR